MNIGESIREYRKIKKYTQIQLADALGKSESTIRKWESGNVNTNILNDIASEFGISVQELIRGPIDEESILQLSKRIETIFNINPVLLAVDTYNELRETGYDKEEALKLTDIINRNYYEKLKFYNYESEEK